MKYWCIKITEENSSILSYWTACKYGDIERFESNNRPYLHDDGKCYQCPQRNCDEIDFDTWKLLPEVREIIEWKIPNYES